MGVRNEEDGRLRRTIEVEIVVQNRPFSALLLGEFSSPGLVSATMPMSG